MKITISGQTYGPPHAGGPRGRRGTGGKCSGSLPPSAALVSQNWCTGHAECAAPPSSAALVSQNWSLVCEVLRWSTRMGRPPPHPLHWSARSGHYCAKCLTGDTEWAAPPLISCTGQPELASTARNSALAMQNEPSTPSSAALVNQNWSLVREVLHWSRRMGRTSPHPLHWSAGIHLTASPSSLTCSLS